MSKNKTMASIFCDGACPGNGTARAIGGWAWAYWPGIAKGEPTFSGAAKLATDGGHPATNQRAELTALLEALRFVAKRPDLTPVTIYTDSMYSLNCTTKWGPGWKRKGWKRDSGEPLLNLDLIMPLVELWRPSVPLVHVRGHQTGSGPEVHGNNWVDRAAVAAAHGPLQLHSLPAPDINIIEHVIEPTIKEKVKERVQVKANPGVLKQADIRMWFGA